MSERYKIGQKVIVEVTGTVVDISDSHGLCYQIEFPQEDYQSPRKVWLEPHEIDEIKLCAACGGSWSYDGKGTCHCEY